MAGRPSKYKPEYCELAKNYCLLGATDVEVAGFLGIGLRTLNDWKIAHADFYEAMSWGKDQADAKVASSLFHRATGYSHPDVDIRVIAGQIVKTDLIKHYPPDSAAGIFWLKNRRGWRDRVDHEVSGKDGAPIQYQAVERKIIDPKAE
jgi:hypothetical protein